MPKGRSNWKLEPTYPRYRYTPEAVDEVLNRPESSESQWDFVARNSPCNSSVAPPSVENLATTSLAYIHSAIFFELVTNKEINKCAGLVAAAILEIKRRRNAANSILVGEKNNVLRHIHPTVVKRCSFYMIIYYLLLMWQ